MTGRRSRRWTLVLWLALPACRGGGEPLAAVGVAGISGGISTPAATAAPAPGAAAGLAPTAAELPTTDGAVAVENLRGQIRSYERALARQPEARDFLAALVQLHTVRARFLGELAGYELAEALAERLVAARPSDPRAYLERAGARLSLHRFAEAAADLAEAERRGSKPAVLREARATLLAATGREAEALALRREASTAAGDVTALGAEAALLADLGHVEEADARFREALGHHRDVSPFPVAWVLFQQGWLWERQGQQARAVGLYEAAVARLPAYAPAVGHLAALYARRGDGARARALLAPLVDAKGSVDDPEYLATDAALLRAEGNAAAADALAARARERYLALLALHPAAFADHAARFFLAPGPTQDLPRALALAQANLRLRPTGEAHALLMEAALAANDAPLACTTADRLLARCAEPMRCGPHLHVLAWRAFSACGQSAQAQQELAALEVRK